MQKKRYQLTFFLCYNSRSAKFLKFKWWKDSSSHESYWIKRDLIWKVLQASPRTSAWALGTGRECSQKWGAGSLELEAGTQTQARNSSPALGQPDINKEFGYFRDSWSDVFALMSDTVSPLSLFETHIVYCPFWLYKTLKNQNHTPCFSLP